MTGVKIKFHRGFTLAELMVILAVMTIVIAAVAPVFTAKYTNITSDNVWNEVNADDARGDIYADAPNHSMLQEVMIGLSPEDLQDIKRNYLPYSKLIIRSSDRVKNGTSTIVQKPIEFRTSGTKQGYLVAGNSNMMLAGNYSNLRTTAIDNTAFGHNALDAITTGSGNTALGTDALNKLTTGNYNTAIGTEAGSSASVTGQSGNVFIGYKSGAVGDYNTIITNNLNSIPASTSYTTAIGSMIRFGGNYNTVIGTNSDATGTGNTVIGPFSMVGFTNGASSRNNEYNTVVGANSCGELGNNAKYKTCIGEAAAVTNTDSILTNDTPAVLIGRSITRGNWNSPATVVVTSKTSTNVDTSYSISNNSNYTTNLNDSAVIIYGNLIVRGQTYMYGRAPFPVVNNKSHYNTTSPALMGYTLHDMKGNGYGDFRALVGLDGNMPTLQLEEGGFEHQVLSGKENCICTYSGGMYGSGYLNAGIQSYDWSAFYRYQSGGTINIFNNGTDSVAGYYWYPNYSENKTNIELNRAHSQYSTTSSLSCCPILTQSTLRGSMDINITSDARLKNIKGKFLNGLDDLTKLRFYNYTYKSDKNLTPQVGVIAQDLKTIFPTSVTKDRDRHLKIRWDEMFYSAINSIKELHNKIITFIDRIENDLSRISKLKDENKQLENKLQALIKEVEELER